jgi:hypothetical protein
LLHISKIEVLVRKFAMDDQLESVDEIKASAVVLSQQISIAREFLASCQRLQKNIQLMHTALTKSHEQKLKREEKDKAKKTQAAAKLLFLPAKGKGRGAALSALFVENLTELGCHAFTEYQADAYLNIDETGSLPYIIHRATGLANSLSGDIGLAGAMDLLKLGFPNSKAAQTAHGRGRHLVTEAGQRGQAREAIIKYGPNAVIELEAENCPYEGLVSFHIFASAADKPYLGTEYHAAGNLRVHTEGTKIMIGFSTASIVAFMQNTPGARISAGQLMYQEIKDFVGRMNKDCVQLLAQTTNIYHTCVTKDDVTWVPPGYFIAELVKSNGPMYGYCGTFNTAPPAAALDLVQVVALSKCSGATPPSIAELEFLLAKIIEKCPVPEEGDAIEHGALQLSGLATPPSHLDDLQPAGEEVAGEVVEQIDLSGMGAEDKKDAELEEEPECDKDEEEKEDEKEESSVKVGEQVTPMEVEGNQEQEEKEDDKEENQDVADGQATPMDVDPVVEEQKAKRILQNRPSEETEPQDEKRAHTDFE